MDEAPHPEAGPARSGHPALRPGSPRRVKAFFPQTQLPPRLAPGPAELTPFQGRLLFAANFEIGARAIWTSDGTSVGTYSLKTFPAGQLPGADARVTQLASTGSQLFFTAGDAPAGNELWVTDGTREGTRRVADLTPGPASSNLTGLTVLGDSLVFFRQIPAAPPEVAHTELWRSDGSTAGTQRVVPLVPGGAVEWRTVRVGGGLLFFVVDTDGSVQAWRTDGTLTGTRVVASFPSEDGGYVPMEMGEAGDMAFFSMFDAEGTTSIWGTDGSSDGTRNLFTLPADGRQPRLLTAVGDKLYFSLVEPVTQLLTLYTLRMDGLSTPVEVATLPNPYASMGEAAPLIATTARAGARLFFELYIGSSGATPRDTQLWVTDGTGAGTKMLRRPLSVSDEYASPLVAADEQYVFFASHSDETGVEPWVTDGTTTGTRLLRDLRPGVPNTYPLHYTRVGDRMYFTAFDDTVAYQLWMVPLNP
ncbi:hypothetical protein LZ198_15325 [Myxococcus sp. K15C18031901]|uniref:hypothetical protein n=1 Tax=Myxococcus dinghuensis TaxID=2906761 RepID=UPI0020A737DC|nr:hypothetical protein [Myxococcus dinghuensis]MCP3100240.1 hypothetical protein [Myxococcus dinghuensis]